MTTLEIFHQLINTADVFEDFPNIQTQGSQNIFLLVPLIVFTSVGKAGGGGRLREL